MKSSAIVLLLLGGLCSTSLAEASQAADGGSSLDGRVEEIYIARSMRESRSSPTDFCAQIRTGFDAALEDQYTFRSVATRPADGRMVDANVATIGRLHACIETTPDGLKFYGEGVVGGISFTAIGDCRALKREYPEPGITGAVCAFDLRDLPTGYVGGQLTTNTVSSQNMIGEKSDPAGYTQPSIATIRLWRRR